jgi:hypothetical protein
MKRNTNIKKGIILHRLVIIIMLVILFAQSSYACTIFVLTDGHRVLFCNNEDWTNPNTRIWFVPAGTGYYGCVYVGYDDGWARGGMNTEGLACDWVGGFMENWQADAVTCVRGNPTQRMLESCGTVEDAIVFFQKHKESDFIRAKILVADRKGTSAIIGVQDGKLLIEKSDQSRGFGYAFLTLRECLTNNSEPTLNNGASILHSCLQGGKYATKYSNVFDLMSGDIYIYQFHQHIDSMLLNLVVELGKGGHYYDMLQIHQQYSQPVLPLLINMKRFFLDDFPPIADMKPAVTNHIRKVIEDVISGKMDAEDYDSELWSSISSMQKDIQTDLKRYGSFKSIALVECKKEGDRYTNRYRIEFENVILLMRFELNNQNKITLFKSDGAERKPGADLGE